VKQHKGEGKSEQVVPKVIWEKRVDTPLPSENALSRVLAVACTMHNEALWKRYGSLRESYGALWNVTEMLQIVTEPLRKISILPITNGILNSTHH